MSKYQSNSIYFYPGTNVLKNKQGIKDQHALESYERQIASDNIILLAKKPIQGNFSLGHMKKIHKFIFSSIYPFAGEVRQEGISKGNTHFAHPNHIDAAAKEIFSELKAERFLKGKSFDEFCERASYYYTEVNMLHPFREGNGRTQRELFRVLGLRNGFNINWNLVGGEELVNASIESVLDETAFKPIFSKVVTNELPDKALIREYKRSLDQLEL